MFGSVNSEVIEHLEFALQGVRGERGHMLEGQYSNPRLVQAEHNLLETILLVRMYIKEGGK